MNKSEELELLATKFLHGSLPKSSPITFSTITGRNPVPPAILDTIETAFTDYNGDTRFFRRSPADAQVQAACGTVDIPQNNQPIVPTPTDTVLVGSIICNFDKTKIAVEYLTKAVIQDAKGNKISAKELTAYGQNVTNEPRFDHLADSYSGGN